MHVLHVAAFSKGWYKPGGPSLPRTILTLSLSSRQMKLDTLIRLSTSKWLAHTRITSSSATGDLSYQLSAGSQGLVHCTMLLFDRQSNVIVFFYHTIVTHRVVFSHRKRTTNRDEILQKCYVIDQAKYFFGPLLCGKPRESYREGRFPENTDIFNISNCGNMQANVEFSLQNDENSTTFILEPSSMTLEPGASQVRKFLIIRYHVT